MVAPFFGDSYISDGECNQFTGWPGKYGWGYSSTEHDSGYCTCRALGLHYM